jgi:Uma2 family endonuclease
VPPLWGLYDTYFGRELPVTRNPTGSPVWLAPVKYIGFHQGENRLNLPLQISRPSPKMKALEAPMSDPLRVENEDTHFTYTDYLSWEGPERYQIIDGEAFMMASPTVEHQAISGEVYRQLANFLAGKPCRVFAAPLDVRLFPEEDLSDDTVVQPDILVVCDSAKLGKGSVNGPPDLVMEIMSPSNSQKEMFLKFEKYLNAGVREYWVLEPEEKKVQVHVLQEGSPSRGEGVYLSSIYKKDAVIPVSILPPLSIDLKTLWAS